MLILLLAHILCICISKASDVAVLSVCLVEVRFQVWFQVICGMGSVFVVLRHGGIDSCSQRTRSVQLRLEVATLANSDKG